jgi:hydroxymethylpyrimidine pyrophosphatase-like HAD family hydrolase
MIRLIITDVEGILTPLAGSQVPWNLEGLLLVRQFLSAQKNRLICILCTGRQSSYGEAVIQALDLFFRFPQENINAVQGRWKTKLLSWPSIVENGTCFYDPLAKRIIPNPKMTEVQIKGIQEISSKAIPLLVDKTGCQVESGKKFSVSLNPPIIKYDSSVRMPIEEFFLIVKDFLKEFEELIEVRYSASAVDIVPVGVSKTLAVQFLMENASVSPEYTLGVGDTQADEEWLEHVGWSATPANGRESLKNVNYVSPYEAEKGFLDILENLKMHHYEKVV